MSKSIDKYKEEVLEKSRKYDELKSKTESLETQQQESTSERESLTKQMKDMINQYEQSKAELQHRIDNMSDTQLHKMQEKITQHCHKLTNQNNELKQNMSKNQMELQNHKIKITMLEEQLRK